MFDSHTHLFDEAFDDDRETILAQMNDLGYKAILVGFNEKTNFQAYNLSSIYNFLYPTAGLHPSDVDENYLDNLQKLRTFLKSHKVYAIGECGLDYYWDKTYAEEQKDALKKQIDLSKQMNLPIVIHCRDAINDCYQILSEYKNINGVMHCYSGSLEMAMKFIDLGMYISLGGPVTFKNAKEPVRVAQNIPIDRLLIETDSPYLSPEPHRGKRNSSLNVKYVLEKISNIRNIDIEVLEHIIDENTRKLFNIQWGVIWKKDLFICLLYYFQFYF